MMVKPSRGDRGVFRDENELTLTKAPHTLKEPGSANDRNPCCRQAVESDGEKEDEEEETRSEREVRHQSDPETYVMPKKPRTKAQSKWAKSKAKTKAKAKTKRVTFTEDTAEDFGNEVAAVGKGSDDSDSPGPPSLPKRSRKVGSRVFKEDRPHILRVFVADLVPFLSLQPCGKCSACKFCKEKAEGDPRYSVTTFGEGSSTGTIRGHFWDQHRHAWITACDTTNPPIKIHGKQGTLAQEYRAENDMQIAPIIDRPAFSLEVLRKLLMKLIVKEDLPISFIEAPTLRNILLIGKESLRNNQIPKRTTMTKLIMESFATEMHTFKDNFKSAMGRISFTTDGWSNFLLYPFIAVIAHWIQKEHITDPKLREQLGLDFTCPKALDARTTETAAAEVD
ncbi:hypothetical protein PQX77_021530 [Marasmius sp. AFHP31]|nr:hypothetical protein PQX77_021530 [Marasmius sp. AFHP31]